MDVEVIIEIPKGSRNKYEMDHETGAIWLDRHLFTATTYPADYGFVNHTLGEDGDPLDALILLPQATFPGCHLWARPIGVFWMSDEKGPDAKVLCVPSRDARYAHYKDLNDAPDFLLKEIANFFEIYKLIEPGKQSSVGEWADAAAAEAEIAAALKRYPL